MKNRISKINFKLLGLFAFVIISAFIPPKYSLTGRWTIPDLNGAASGEFVDFKDDNTYSVSLSNGQIGERGNYLLKDSIFLIKNIKDVCGSNYWGKYNLTFYGEDSVHLTLIEDSCSARRMDLVGFNPGLKRQTVK